MLTVLIIYPSGNVGKYEAFCIRANGTYLTILTRMGIRHISLAEGCKFEIL